LTDFSSAQLTGLDAVLTGFFASRELFDWTPVDEAMRQAAYQALQRMHAERLAEQPLETMSTGEQRRVIIARALVNQPHTLVLDEPTNGLDVVAATDLLHSLEHLAQQGVTLIVVTHHVTEIPRVTKQVLLLRGGRVFAAGTPMEIFRSDLLSELFERPMTLTGELAAGTLRLEIASE
jgi:iron complex transport system ATP-binding protein